MKNAILLYNPNELKKVKETNSVLKYFNKSNKREKAILDNDINELKENSIYF